MAAPTGEKVEIEWTAGVWSDITTDVDWNVGISITRGRTNQFTAPQAATFTCRLSNQTGKYTPGTQVLKDLTPNPNWPNVLPRKRIRYSYTITGTTYYRFTGYIKDWPPQLENGVLGYVPIVASDMLDRLAKLKLDNVMVSSAQSIANVAVLYPCGDATGPYLTPTNDALNLISVRQQGVGGAQLFGVPGPDPEQTNAVRITSVDANNGVYFSGPTGSTVRTNEVTLEVWFRTTVVPTGVVSRLAEVIGTHSAPAGLGIDTSGRVASSFPIAAVGSNMCDGVWHQAGFTFDSSNLASIYVDGALGGSTSSAIGSYLFDLSQLYVGQSVPFWGTSNVYSGDVAFVALYAYAMTAQEVADRYATRLAVAGDKTGTRIGRYLAHFLDPSLYSVATGQVAVGEHTLLGTNKKLIDAANELADTESGGAILHVLPTGVVRYDDATARIPAAPVLTFDATRDLVYPGWQPSGGGDTLVNSSTLTHEGGSTVSYRNDDSIALFDEFEDTAGSTVYPDSDQAALNVAAYRVNSQATPAFRLPTFQVNLVTALTAGLYAAWGAVTTKLGTRLRIANLPAGVTNSTQTDVILEGYTESSNRAGGTSSYLLTINTTPADNPPEGIWDSAVYGRWMPDDGALTLQTTLPNKTGTTVIIATAAATPTLSTSAGDYPVTITIGSEDITLTGVPGGGTSPQTFTSCTRGVNGTFAIPHTAGDAVTVTFGSYWAAG